jgi:hypothetical protein
MLWHTLTNKAPALLPLGLLQPMPHNNMLLLLFVHEPCPTTSLDYLKAHGSLIPSLLDMCL